MSPYTVSVPPLLIPAPELSKGEIDGRPCFAQRQSARSVEERRSIRVGGVAEEGAVGDRYCPPALLMPPPLYPTLPVRVATRPSARRNCFVDAAPAVVALCAGQSGAVRVRCTWFSIPSPETERNCW